MQKDEYRSPSEVKFLAQMQQLAGGPSQAQPVRTPVAYATMPARPPVSYYTPFQPVVSNDDTSEKEFMNSASLRIIGFLVSLLVLYGFVSYQEHRRQAHVNTTGGMQETQAQKEIRLQALANESKKLDIEMVEAVAAAGGKVGTHTLPAGSSFSGATQAVPARQFLVIPNGWEGVLPENATIRVHGPMSFIAVESMGRVKSFSSSFELWQLDNRKTKVIIPEKRVVDINT